MAKPKLSRLDLQIMDTLWSEGALSIREVLDRFPKKDKPAYTTIQTMVYRLEAKKAVRRLKKVGNAHVFEPLISRDDARGKLIDDLLSLLGGKAKPVMAHLVETRKLTLEDVKETEELIRKLAESEAGQKQEQEKSR